MPPFVEYQTQHHAIQEEHFFHEGMGISISKKTDYVLSISVTLFVHNGTRFYVSGTTTPIDIAEATYVLDQSE